MRGLLNSHSRITIAAELHPLRVPSLRPLLSEVADYHRDEWTPTQCATVVKALWFALSRPAESSPSSPRWGMKTPWAELENDFWTPLVNPLYVYALRRGDRVFASQIKLGWKAANHPQKLIDRYKESLRVAEKLSGNGLAHIVQLDRSLNPDSRQGLVEGVFSFIGETPDAGVRGFLEEWPDHWSKPTSSTGQDPSLPPSWQRLLEADRDYQRLMENHGY